MSELASTYTPTSVEGKWYDYWIRHDCFTAHPERVSERRPAYSIVIPPPNVTGMLTLGHALNHTIQDILARRARMLGKEVLWLPGTDHAGIATQNVVEKTLRKEGVMRHRDDLGREALVAKIWEWREKYGGIILQQDRALGCSLDWSRTRFTMDEAYSRCVSRVFVDLYKKGLIYRGKRMVHWCPVALTALSDEEVVMKPTNGTLYYFKVEVVEEPGTWLHIATTRPETIPGDTGIAVNPADLRYASLIGKHVRRPLPREEQEVIPIVGDSAVTFDFGTGVLKVTPAHDKADFEIGQRHGLAPREVIDERGVMNAAAGADLAGLDRFEARKKAVEVLREIGALDKEEPYQNNVGYSERADVPVEPRLSEQWFLRYPSQQDSRNVVSSGDMRFFPERWVKVYDHWMGNLQDWCISRQLWWGHRIPVWKRSFRGTATELTELCVAIFYNRSAKTTEHEIGKTAFRINGRLFCDVLELPVPEPGAASEVADFEIEVATTDPMCEENLRNKSFSQDPDVLDTWFSSWLWPFATMGWPEKTDTLKKFYPTTDLVTGPDIIFFWVARMIMAGYEYLGEMPFRNVYFTGIIRDKQGRKMSKSLGNSPDPLDLIGSYGADALRFGVMRSAPLGQDILFDEKNVELGRNFCTKLWNAARFRQIQESSRVEAIDATLLLSDDKRILLQLEEAIKTVSSALDAYDFAGATAQLYSFFWGDFCDWYLEASKAAINGTDAARKANTLAVVDFVLSQTLRLMHPFLPFVTEELWHGLGYSNAMPASEGGATIMFAPWPKPLGESFRTRYQLDEADRKLADAKYEVVIAGRGLRREFNLQQNQRARFVLRATTKMPPAESAVIRLLLNAEELGIVGADWSAPKGTPSARTELGELFLPLEGVIDLAAERVRLTKELKKVADELVKVRSKLASASFVQSAPPQVVAEHRQREANWQERLNQLERMIEGLGS